jgi:hypothetical protein
MHWAIAKQVMRGWVRSLAERRKCTRPAPSSITVATCIASQPPAGVPRGRFRGEPEPELPAQQAHDPGDCIDGPCCVDEGHRPHECGRGDGGVPPDAQRHVPNEQGCHGQWHEMGEVTLKIIGDGSTWEYEDDHRDDEMESHHRADPVVRHADRV